MDIRPESSPEFLNPAHLLVGDVRTLKVLITLTYYDLEPYYIASRLKTCKTKWIEQFLDG